MYDADEERLDTFDRLARLCFMSTYSTHLLISTTDPEEALAESEAVVLSVDENCARRLLDDPIDFWDEEPPQNDRIQDAASLLIADLPIDVPVLSLLSDSIHLPRPTYYRSTWPGPQDKNRFRMPMQILRWLNKEDMLYELLSKNENSPLKAWLDDPHSAELVLGGSGRN